MKALVLERKGMLSLRDVALPEIPGPGQLKIKVDTVGICGSDVHYYTHGRIGPFVVNEPMVLGHEAAGTVVGIGAGVREFALGDRVCMEPGIADMKARASRLGLYNVDPNVTFWATPPVHGCLTPYVIHSDDFTFRLPENVSFAEGAMVEPFAVGLHATNKAGVRSGDVALIIGAGPIGIMTALAALASGCSRVVISDVVAEKLDIAARYPGVITVKADNDSIADVVHQITGGWGVDVVFEASGSPQAYLGIFALIRPGGCLAAIGMPVEPISLDIVDAAAKEIRIEKVFRYANVFGRAVEMIASGKIDLKPLVSETFSFENSVAAFERAAEKRPRDVKLQIRMPHMA